MDYSCWEKIFIGFEITHPKEAYSFDYAKYQFIEYKSKYNVPKKRTNNNGWSRNGNGYYILDFPDSEEEGDEEEEKEVSEDNKMYIAMRNYCEDTTNRSNYHIEWTNGGIFPFLTDKEKSLLEQLRKEGDGEISFVWNVNHCL